MGAFFCGLIFGIVWINQDDIKTFCSAFCSEHCSAFCSAFCSAQQETVTVTAGEDVTIPCTSVAAYPGWTGPEMYNGIAINYNNPGQSNFANPNIPQQKKARLDWASDNKNLIIKNVAVTDKGLYTYGGVQINLLVRDTWKKWEDIPVWVWILCPSEVGLGILIYWMIWDGGVKKCCRTRHFVGIGFVVAILVNHIATIAVVCGLQWCPPGVWAWIVAPCIIGYGVMIARLVWKYCCCCCNRAKENKRPEEQPMTETKTDL